MKHLLIVMLVAFQYTTAKKWEYKPSAYDEYLFREQQKILIDEFNTMETRLLRKIAMEYNSNDDIQWTHNVLRIPSNLLQGLEPELSANQVKEISDRLGYFVVEHSHDKYNNTWNFRFEWDDSRIFNNNNNNNPNFKFDAEDMLRVINRIFIYKSTMINWCYPPFNNTCQQYLSENETVYNDGQHKALQENFEKLFTESMDLSSDPAWAEAIKEIADLNKNIHAKEQNNTTIEDFLLTFIKSKFEISNPSLHTMMNYDYNQVDRAEELLSRWRQHTVSAILWKIRNESPNLKESILSHLGTAK